VRCQSHHWQTNPCCWYLCCQTTAPATRTSTTLTDRHSSPVPIHKVYNRWTNKEWEYTVAPHFHQLCMYVCNEFWDVHCHNLLQAYDHLSHNTVGAAFL
jgi:hypothetical protein